MGRLLRVQWWIKRLWQIKNAWKMVKARQELSSVSSSPASESEATVFSNQWVKVNNTVGNLLKIVFWN